MILASRECNFPSMCYLLVKPHTQHVDILPVSPRDQKVTFQQFSVQKGFSASYTEDKVVGNLMNLLDWLA